MRISAKGRYALAALIEIAKQANRDEPISVITLAMNLGVSKIFLEQTMAGLKKGGIIYAVKGARGGYQLSREPHKITALEALQAVENTLFESSEQDVLEEARDISRALSTLIFAPLDKAVEDTLARVTLLDLLDTATAHGDNQSFMLYI